MELVKIYFKNNLNKHAVITIERGNSGHLFDFDMKLKL